MRLAGGRLRLGAGCGHARRGGSHLRVGVRRDRRPARAGRGGARDHAATGSRSRGNFEGSNILYVAARGRRSERDGSRGPAEAARRSRPSGRSRRATTRRSPPGTASRSPRSPRPRASSTGPTTSRRPSRLAEFLLGPMTDDGRTALPHVSGRTGEDQRLPRGLRERRERSARALHGDGRAAAPRGGDAGSPCSRSISSTTSGTAASSSRRSDGEELVARRKELDDHPTPSGNSMLAFVLLRLARIYGDEELERLAVGVFRLALPIPRPRPGCGRPHALRPRSPLLPAAGGRGHRRGAWSACDRVRSRERAAALRTDNRVRVRGGGRTIPRSSACRSSTGRASSTGGRRRTSVRASRAGRP